MQNFLILYLVVRKVTARLLKVKLLEYKSNILVGTSIRLHRNLKQKVKHTQPVSQPFIVTIKWTVSCEVEKHTYKGVLAYVRDAELL